MIATIAVSIAAAAAPLGAAVAADTCLAAPKGETPAGQHWFYRLEPGTKRHCWYLGDKGKISSREPTSSSAGPATQDPSPSSPNVLAFSAGDARAEWQAQTLTENDKKLTDRTESPTIPVAPDSFPPGNPGHAAAANLDLSSQAGTAAQPNGATSSAPMESANLATATVNQAAASTPEPNTIAVDRLFADRLGASADALPEPRAESATIAAAEPDNSEIGTSGLLIGMTLIGLGALILLGLLGGVIYRRVAAQARGGSDRRFGRTWAGSARPATQPRSDADDNLQSMRELLGRLKNEAPPAEAAVAPYLPPLARPVDIA